VEVVAAGLAAAPGAAEFLFYPAMPGNSTARPAEKWALQARGRAACAALPASGRLLLQPTAAVRRKPEAAAWFGAGCSPDRMGAVHDGAGAAAPRSGHVRRGRRGRPGRCPPTRGRARGGCAAR